MARVSPTVQRQQLCNIRTDRRRDSIHIAYAEGFLDQNTNMERRRQVGGVGEGQPQVYSPPEAGLLRMPVLHVHVVTCSKVEKSGSASCTCCHLQQSGEKWPRVQDLMTCRQLLAILANATAWKRGQVVARRLNPWSKVLIHMHMVEHPPAHSPRPDAPACSMQRCRRLDRRRPTSRAAAGMVTTRVCTRQEGLMMCNEKNHQGVNYRDTTQKTNQRERRWA
jgi:hypothetical protein